MGIEKEYHPVFCLVCFSKSIFHPYLQYNERHNNDRRIMQFLFMYVFIAKE